MPTRRSFPCATTVQDMMISLQVIADFANSQLLPKGMHFIADLRDACALSQSSSIIILEVGSRDSLYLEGFKSFIDCCRPNREIFKTNSNFNQVMYIYIGMSLCWVIGVNAINVPNCFSSSSVACTSVFCLSCLFLTSLHCMSFFACLMIILHTGHLLTILCMFEYKTFGRLLIVPVISPVTVTL